MAINVIGSEFDGAFAQYCVVPARYLHDVSAAPLSDVEIGAMPCAYGTANNMLVRVGWPWASGCLSPVRRAGLALLRCNWRCARGAQVTGQCSAAKAAIVTAQGADVLDRDCGPRTGQF